MHGPALATARGEQTAPSSQVDLRGLGVAEAVGTGDASPLERVALG